MSHSASGSRRKPSPSRRARGERRAIWLAAPVAVALLAYLAPSPSRAAEVDETRLDQCRRVSDSLERLVCFDGLASSKEAPIPRAASAPAQPSATAQAGASYQQVSLTDLQVDAKELRGRSVEATGVMQQVGQLVMLKETLLSMNAVFVEIDTIPREERRRIFQMCGQGCTATVRGKAMTVMMNPGIKAEHVDMP